MVNLSCVEEGVRKCPRGGVFILCCPITMLGLWLDDTESATFWFNVFNELKSRGVQEILIAVSDGLSGMSRSLETAFPRTPHQTCIAHLISNSLTLLHKRTGPRLDPPTSPSTER